MKIYDCQDAKSIPLSKAIKKMTPEWIEQGWNCEQTTIDALAACAQLLKENRKLKRDLKIATIICENVGHGIDNGSIAIDKQGMKAALSKS